MIFEWDALKNQKLKQGRGISFDDVVTAIEEDRVLDVIPHPNSKKYPSQFMMIVEIYEYAYCVPFTRRDAEVFFLKTIFPNRKMTRDYIINKKKWIENTTN
jgi:uncharacterized DUF497 family protein